ncbi:MAG TPA: YraN family protein [Candidatus Aquilonibacter sp.]|nr:YraN family protein [Candidatus Aquilonibacter sp.]
MLARMVFAAMNFAARKGLAAPDDPSLTMKQRSRVTGIRGETYAYWYLRSKGYLMVARNYTVPGLKGEIDMAGYDGGVLAFVEVKTRTVANTGARQVATAEEAVNAGKRRNVSRMAQQFLRARRIEKEPYRFDVLAIETRAGSRPQIRLHKGAYTS